MIGFVIVRAGKFLSPHGYVARADQAQWYRSREEAAQSIVDMRPLFKGVVEGAEVQEVRLPNEGVQGHYAQVDSDYDPFGFRR